MSRLGPVAAGVAAFAFLLALGAVLWSVAGPAVFTALVDVGLALCG